MNSRAVKSYLYEGLVIVGSILVAFALDASWANFQESRVEQKVLLELHEELQSAKARIEFSITELVGVIEASSDLVDSLGEDTPILSANAAQDLVLRIFNINTLEVPTSVVDSIVASGQVRLISNGEIRKALAQWPALISDVRENHEWHRVETDEFLNPYLARYVSIRDAVVRNGRATFGLGSFAYDLAPMQRDPVFEGRLVQRISRQQATLSESKILLDGAENLLSLIAIEIGQ
jgi:hypothetical protein